MDIKSFFDFDKFKSETKPVLNETETPNESVPKNSGTSQVEAKTSSTEATTRSTPEVATSQTGVAQVQNIVKNIDPKAFIEMGDVVLSRGFSFLANWLGGYATTYKDFKLDADEKRSLSPYFETIVAEWIKNLTPMQAFAVVFTMIYGGKAVTVATEQRPVKKISKKVTQQNNVSNNIPENNPVATGKRGRPFGSVKK